MHHQAQRSTSGRCPTASTTAARAQCRTHAWLRGAVASIGVSMATHTRVARRVGSNVNWRTYTPMWWASHGTHPRGKFIRACVNLKFNSQILALVSQAACCTDVHARRARSASVCNTASSQVHRCVSCIQARVARCPGPAVASAGVNCGTCIWCFDIACHVVNARACCRPGCVLRHWPAVRR